MYKRQGLQPVEKTVIDRCVHQIYQTYFENPVPENMPVLQDLSLIHIYLQTFVVQVTMLALSAIIFVIVYGRMVEIYLSLIHI